MNPNVYKSRSIHFQNGGEVLNSPETRATENNDFCFCADSSDRRDTDATYDNTELKRNTESVLEPDSPKMFVGQLPRSMDETQLRVFFEQFGAVHSLNVLREDGVSKGCCFVTFYARRAALMAENALHRKITLAGMHNPIQMKLADSCRRNDRKLFVGLLHKELTDDDVRKLLEVYGSIEECMVLRDINGKSKGCAFVTYERKEVAALAVELAKGQHFLMKGCLAPLMVKFADTQKEKEQKKIQQDQRNLSNMPTNLNIPLSQTSTESETTPMLLNTVQQQGNPAINDVLKPEVRQLWHDMMQAEIAAKRNSAARLIPPIVQQKCVANAINNYDIQPFTQTYQPTADASLLSTFVKDNLLTPSNSVYDTQLFAQFYQADAALKPPMLEENLAASSNNLYSRKYQPTADAGRLQPKVESNLIAPALYDIKPFAHTYQTSIAYAALLPPMTTLSNTVCDLNAIAQNYQASAATDAFNSSVLASAVALAAGKNTEGPEGCNLFIYHLPVDFGDIDLATIFLPFGSLLSSKVFVDKQTNLSKCFGFVSYDNPTAAQLAIKGMNGFKVGTKSLKVQLKKPKTEYQPF